MNPVVRCLILQWARKTAKQRKEGTVKFSFVKSSEKFLQGGGITLVATVLALLLEKEPTETAAVVDNLSHNLMVSIPVIGALLTSIVNAIKFFIKRKINEGGE
jgi:hypothetical protein